MDRKQISAEISSLEAALRQKIAERDQLSIEILRIQENIRNLNTMYFAEALAEKGRQLTAVGLTEALRIVLRKQGSPLTAGTLKAALEVLGFDLKRFRNPASAVHNTLIRMRKAGELSYNTTNGTYQFAETRNALRSVRKA